MKRTGTRARVALGSAVSAVAVLAVAGSLTAAPRTAPPSTPPDSEPTETAADSTPTLLDPERETLVDEILASSGDAGFQLDRDCVAGVVAQIPEDEVDAVSAEIASIEETAVATGAMPEATVVEVAPVGSEITEPAATVTDQTIVETVPMDTDLAPSEPTLSPETEALGQQLVTCARGDADPALVAEAIAVIEADPEAPAFDMVCVASVLTTFSDETLTLIIDDTDDQAPTETAAGADLTVEVVPATDSVAGPAATEPAATEPVASDEVGLDLADPLDSISEEAMSEAFTLLACAPEFVADLDSMSPDVAAVSEPGSATETAPVDTAEAEPTESTTG